MKLTEELIEAGRSLNGGWSRAQTSCLGVPWPLEHGWKKDMIGVEVSESDYARFLALKDRHLGGRSLERVADALLEKSRVKTPKPKTPQWAKERAKALVKSASGSNTFTCVATNCTYPMCQCELGR